MFYFFKFSKKNDNKGERNLGRINHRIIDIPLVAGYSKRTWFFVRPVLQLSFLRVLCKSERNLPNQNDEVMPLIAGAIKFF